MKSALNITFLGTGTSQGIPVIGSDHPVCLSNDPRDKRLRVSILIQWDEFNVVIDCGPDFRQQMLTAEISKLDALLLTHEHSDHVAGIDDIRPFYFKQGDIPFYAHSRVFEALHKRFDYIFAEENKYPGVPTIDEQMVDKNHPFDLFGKKVIPIEAMHGNLPVLGYRIDNFAYLTDVKTISDVEVKKLLNLDVLVINVLRAEEHHSHLNISEALELIDTIQPKQSYFTHISHVMGFHNEVDAKLPRGINLAYDMLQIRV